VNSDLNALLSGSLFQCKSGENILTGKLNNDEMHSATEQHMHYWQNFRQSATPIFEWLYRVSRTQMERNILVDTDELISDFNKN
jgi:hypothetical protein